MRSYVLIALFLVVFLQASRAVSEEQQDSAGTLKFKRWYFRGFWQFSSNPRNQIHAKIWILLYSSAGVRVCVFSKTW